MSEAALRRVEELYPGVKASSSIHNAITDSNLIIYGVKPQNISKVHTKIRRAKLDGAGRVRDDAIILLVVAGTPIKNYVDGLLVEKVVRSMPNTPAHIACVVTVWSCTDNIDSNERKRITAAFDSFGKTVFVEDESSIDMSTSISGLGTAYVFMLMEAMVDAEYTWDSVGIPQPPSSITPWRTSG